MADVFISYRRDERETIEQIAEALRRLAIETWFDARLDAGESFNQEIDREARGAAAILVCWSPAAIQSDWVQAESLIGFNARKLAACFIAGPPSLEPPAPFNAIHAADIRGWADLARQDADAAARHPGWQALLKRLQDLLKRPGLIAYALLPPAAQPARRSEALERWATTYHDDKLAAAAWEEIERLTLDNAKASIALKRADAARKAEAAKPQTPPPQASASLDRDAEQARAWAAIGLSPTKADLEAFIATWKHGPFVDLARNKLDRFEEARQSSPNRPSKPEPKQASAAGLAVGGIAIIAVLLAAAVFLMRPSSSGAAPAAAPTETLSPATAPSVAAPAVDSMTDASAPAVDINDPDALRFRLATRPGDAPAAQTASMEQALSKLDETAWSGALAKDTPAAYDDYLKKFGPTASPPGLHATEAAGLVARAKVISRLQRALAEWFNDEVRVNGILDSTTLSAVRRFSDLSGIAGPGRVWETAEIVQYAAQVETWQVPSDPAWTQSPKKISDCILAPPPPFVVYFEWDKDDLTPANRDTIDQSLSRAHTKSCAVAAIYVDGFNETDGPKKYSLKLGWMRGQTVKSELVRAGFPANKIFVHSFGETNLAKVTNDGVREPLNRRAEVRMVY